MYLFNSSYKNVQLPTLVLFFAMSVLVASASAATSLIYPLSTITTNSAHSDNRLAMEVIDTQIFPGKDITSDSKTAASEPEGLWRPFNEIMFSINIGIDQYLLRPVARTWAKFAPNLLRQTLDNFFHNLELPHTVANQMLQGRLDDAGHNTARFIFNSTMGLGGAIDVGDTLLNLPEGKDADLGQTLAFWGVPQGPYLMLPLAGPTTLRNIPDLAMSALFDPLNYEPVETGTRIGTSVAEIVNKRSYLIGIDSVLYDSVNPYVLSRDLYLQSRASFIAEVVPEIKSDSNNYKIQDDDSFFDSVEQGQP